MDIGEKQLLKEVIAKVENARATPDELSNERLGASELYPNQRIHQLANWSRSRIRTTNSHLFVKLLWTRNSITFRIIKNWSRKILAPNWVWFFQKQSDRAESNAGMVPSGGTWISWGARQDERIMRPSVLGNKRAWYFEENQQLHGLFPNG